MSVTLHTIGADTAYAYASIAEAKSYLAFVSGTVLDSLTATQISQYLVTSTRAIDSLNILGKKNVSTQPLEFPRNSKTTIPDDIRDACILNAEALADDVDPVLEFENAYTIAQQLDVVRSQQEENVAQQHISALIASPQAWRLIVPYLRENNTIVLKRR